MTTWGTICRICSSPADYEIFAKIPTYLHSTTNEFLNWQKPINLLLEETTGLKVLPDDSLPRYICAPCISYLKHAVTFREQSINNAISLKLADLYHQKKNINTSNPSNSNSKETALYTAEDLSYVEQRPVSNILLNNSLPDKVEDKQLINQLCQSNGGDQRVQYLNVLFNKTRQTSRKQNQVADMGISDLDLMPTTSSGNGTAEDEEDYAAVSSSSEDNENPLLRQHKNCYNYRETNFEEDDPMAESAQLRDIKVHIPQPMWKERKCPVCSKRFMFEESYQKHLDNCVEYQFVVFVTEMTKLLDIRRHKMVSPHEFIRRMIFALRKICSWLEEHSIDTMLSEKLNQVKVSNGRGKSQETELELDLNLELEQPPQPFEPSYNSGLTTPITMENNVLYAIARSESRNSQAAANTDIPQRLPKPIPIRGIKPSQPADEERATFLEKLQRANVPKTSTTPVNAGLVFTARCGQCNLSFDSVSELEIHNISHHNTGQTPEITSSADDEAQRRRIIALFEDDI
ncbi:uncharacterized protein [Drosophila tropicalis]|uniref:uncharacterized protein n=1 Tax=Drosophila tropicalis TaxID=46794 RepID=UPI0035AB6E0B